MPSFRKRPGLSGRNQQVFKHWDFATAREKTVTIEHNESEIHGRTDPMARPSDHETAEEAASSISRAEATRLENIVADACKFRGYEGMTWDEAPKFTHLDKGSISPRWKPLRHRRLIVFALIEEEILEVKPPLLDYWSGDLRLKRG
jgi:hypothetical protein